MPWVPEIFPRSNGGILWFGWRMASQPKAEAFTKLTELFFFNKLKSAHAVSSDTQLTENCTLKKSLSAKCFLIFSNFVRNVNCQELFNSSFFLACVAEETKPRYTRGLVSSATQASFFCACPEGPLSLIHPGTIAVCIVINILIDRNIEKLLPFMYSFYYKSISLKLFNESAQSWCMECNNFNVSPDQTLNLLKYR